MSSRKRLQDLTECAQEPIRTPEHIQPFGCVLVIDNDARLHRYSQNAPALLDQPSLSQSLHLNQIFHRGMLAQCNDLLMRLVAAPEQVFSTLIRTASGFIALYVYRSDTFNVIEVIPSHAHSNADSLPVDIRALSQSMRQTKGLHAKLALCTQFCRQEATFSRAMVYQFDQDNNGSVIAESCDAGLTPYLGLHFPAADIPAQARALYLENIVRVIPDATYTPCALSAVPASDTPLDLGPGMLRAVSPYHLTYMANMGTQASLVGALIISGKLWGLMVCHHNQPFRFSYEFIEAFRGLVMLMAQEIEVNEIREQEHRRRTLVSLAHSAVSELRETQQGIQKLLEGQKVNRFLQKLGADGLAYVMKNEFFRTGQGPAETASRRLIAELLKRGTWDACSTYASHHMPTEVAMTPQTASLCAGALLVPVKTQSQACLLFTRQEVVQKVTWGGNPDRLALWRQQDTLSPEHSFAAWHETMTGTSEPWHKEEIEAAVAFAGTLDIELKQRAEQQLRLLSNALEHINDTVIITDAELDAPGPRIVYVNLAFERQTGFSRDEVIGHTPRLLQGPETSDETLREIRHKLERQQPVRVEIINYTKARRKFYTELEITPLRDHQGNVSHFTSIQRDITVRRAYEKTLQFLADNDWRADRQRFILDLSHHIVNLLDVSGMLVVQKAESQSASPVYLVTSALLNDTEFTEVLFTSNVDLQQADTDECFFIEPDFAFTACDGEPKDWQLQPNSWAAGLWVAGSSSEPETLILLISERPLQTMDAVVPVMHQIKTHVALETFRRQANDLIWQQANFDTLTGVPNRRMFRDRLCQAVLKQKRQESQGALLLLDLDNFKEINDIHGHIMGDKLLIQAVKRIQHRLRQSDTMARLGGDEFAILLDKVENIGDVLAVAQHTIEDMRAPFRIESHLLHSSVSIGVAIFPSDSADPDELIAYADQAMYQAKNAGRNQCSFFTSSLQKEVQRRSRLTNELHEAIARDELGLAFQPIVELPSRKIVKAEALLRWHHPMLGQISPTEFIPIAEETGQIIEIGEWVFAQVVSYLVSLKQRLDIELQISVNKSGRQFRKTNESPMQWPETLKKAGVPATAVIIEITESSVVEDRGRSEQVLQVFRDEGLQVAIDDFGTGFSALAYLQRNDIDYLKIDMSFVQRLTPASDELALIEAIVAMGHRLNMKVVAEGIETEEQLGLLETAGVDLGQGFLFSKPVSATTLELLITRQYTDLSDNTRPPSRH